MRTVTGILLALILLLPAIATGAEGTQGFQLCVEAHRNHIGADDAAAGDPPDALYVDEVGGGGALSLGWGFTPTFALRLTLAGSRHETTRENVEVQLNGVTLEAVHYFQPGRPLRPFVFGGLGGFAAESRDEPFAWETEGGGACFGGGLAYFVSDDFALTFTARADAINWDKARGRVTLPGGDELVIEQPVDEGGVAGRFAIGMGWWF